MGAGASSTQSSTQHAKPSIDRKPVLQIDQRSKEASSAALVQDLKAQVRDLHGPQGSASPIQRAVSGSSAGSNTPGFKGPELNALFGTDFQPDPELIRAIEAKQCIAFVGAGFTAPITQLTWKSLLIKMLEESVAFFRTNDLEGRYEELMERLKPNSPSAEDYALVAQEIQDMLGEDKFEEFIQKQCKLPESTILTPDMVHRIRCMSRITFKAIITTNYNSCFSGLEKNIEPALLHGSINPCTLWESILRGCSHDKEGNLLDDQEEVIHGAQTLDGEQDSEENSVDSYAEVKESMTLKAALAKYQFRCPILKIHGCVEYVNQALSLNVASISSFDFTNLLSLLLILLHVIMSTSLIPCPGTPTASSCRAGVTRGCSTKRPVLRCSLRLRWLRTPCCTLASALQMIT